MRLTKTWFKDLPWLTRDFRVNGVGVQESMPPCVIDRPRGTGDFLFMYFHMPTMIGDSSGSFALCPPGRMIIWTKGARQHYGHPAQAYQHSWLHCDGTWVERQLKRLKLPVNEAFALPDIEVFEHFLFNLRKELANHARPDARIALNLLENWLRDTARALKPTAAEKPASLLEIRRHLDAHYLQPVKLRELAEKAHLSVPHFCAEFKRHFGMPAVAYALHLRLQEAAYLLHDRNLRIAEVAARAGFKDIYYFSRLFRKRFGMPPRQWRSR